MAGSDDAVRSVVMDYVDGWFEAIEIRIDYLSGGIASALCYCHRYVDLLHLIEMPDAWKIVNSAWRLR